MQITHGIGEHVKSERIKAGLTQQELADKAQVGINFVYQLEKNKPSVQMDSVIKVLSALGLRIQITRSNESILDITDINLRPDPWTTSQIS